MKGNSEYPAIIIFPYLFIREEEGLEVDELKIKSSHKENISKEEERAKNHLLNIVKLLKSVGKEGIPTFSYSFTKISNINELENLKEKLNKLANILRFSQLKNLKERASFEHFNYFIFLTFTEKNYYIGFLNGESRFEFYIIDGKPYVEGKLYNIYNIDTLVLSAKQIKEDPYFKIFYTHKDSHLKDNEKKKILRAIEWFNRSYSHYGRGVDLSESVLNIHTAIEALLRPEYEERGVKAQIKTALLNILGHSKELEEWFYKFWKLRNSIVHGDVKLEPFFYIHTKAKKGHRHHLYIARKIFVSCLDTILRIRLYFPYVMPELEKELIPNEYRINRSIEILKNQKEYDLKNLCQTEVLQLILDLTMDDLSASKSQTKEFGKLFLPFVKKDLEENENQEILEENENQEINQVLIEKIDKILEWRGNEFTELATLYSELKRDYRRFANESERLNLPTWIQDFRKATLKFLEFATWRLLTIYD